MQRIYILIFVLLVTGFVRGDTGVTRIVARASRPRSVRSAQDPLVVNSKSIALKLENSRVRVLEATLEPGVKEKMHSHPAYVIYVIGDVIYRDPITHWAENIGTTTIRLELVELKN
jgi:hypothetical protein